MLSICIPVYNYTIKELIFKLDFLAAKLEIPYELIIVDDCSETVIKEDNQKIAESVYARYIELHKNIGRSAIRNLLSKEAKYSNLLFLDCDSQIINENFLVKYLPYLNQKQVVYGGRIYQKDSPEKEFLLHWNYGLKRESKPVELRKTFPTRYFSTNNFLISREILKRFPLNEKLRDYGHEDTFLAIELYQNHISVIHIENPVLHEGLETNEIFISKTEAGIHNLCLIENMVFEHEVLHKHVHLLEVFSKIKKFRLVEVIKFVWSISKHLLVYLIQKHYIMIAFDLYKLGFLCSIYKKSTAQTNDASFI